MRWLHAQPSYSARFKQLIVMCRHETGFAKRHLLEELLKHRCGELLTPLPADALLKLLEANAARKSLHCLVSIKTDTVHPAKHSMCPE